MVWTLSRRSVAVAVLCTGGVTAPQAGHAQEVRQAFRIPAGPAAEGVAALAAQARMDVLASSDVLAGRRTNEVVGTYTAAEALDKLVAGTGLVARSEPNGTFIVPATPVRKAQEAGAVPPRIVVVGMRASQQSSISGKKYADTAIDMVVAEDVSSFPDKNMGEAVSRIAGVSLERGDYGEGVSVGLRGLTADMTRVEIDGLGVISAGGAALQGADDRGMEFRELPSDLIKSVEVVKGATAADTEGGLAGTIHIHTRSGLDFKKRHLSVRLAAAANTINKKWGPDQSIVFADRFLGGRVGVIGTVNRSRAYNENHRQDLSNNGNNGPSLSWDFDQSPEKTFAFNPATLSRTDPAVDQPTGNSPFALTPRELVSRSANARTKADCYASIPLLTNAQLNTLAGTDRGPAAALRGLELSTCLNQWNDYTPTNIRSFVKRQDDQRLSSDLRVDFRVSDKLVLFAKGTRQTRLVWDTFLYQALGQFDGLGTINGPAYTGPTYSDDPVANVRTAVPASGYGIVPGLSLRNNDAPLSGVLTNVDPATVVVDAAHHVIRATVADGSVDTTKQYDRIDTANNYLQLGGTYRDGPFKADFTFGRVRSNFMREVRRFGVGYVYGPVTLSATPDGLWTYTFPAGSGYDQRAFVNYAQVFPQPARDALAATVNNPAAPGYGTAQLPLTGPGIRMEYTPYGGETGEDTLKADLRYAFERAVPVVSALRFGMSRRQYDNRSWNPGGYQVSPASGTYGTSGYVAPVVVPSSRYRNTSIVPCADTPGSVAPGGLPCAYGYTPQTNLSLVRQGQLVLTQQQYQSLLDQVMRERTAPFFNSAKGRPPGLIDGWYDLDVMKMLALSGLPNFDTSCVKYCAANDGKVYEQAVNAIRETVTAGYLMADFALDKLPFGLDISGNWGVRYVRTREVGSGLFNLNSITKTAAFDPANPDRPQGIASTSVTRIASINDAYTNVLPSFNAASWLRPNRLLFRYNWATMIGRPKVSQLVPGGSCTYDERKAEQGLAMNCEGRVGNPGLRPWTSKNQNASLEYYPDRDSMLTLAYFRHHGVTGAPVQATLSGVRPFKGSAVADPASGRPLSDLSFIVPTYENGPGVSRDGWEVAGKTVFSFLPWRLRYTGVDFNFTKIRSRNSGAQYRDLNSGDLLPTSGEPGHTYNLSLWYDDGALQARVALQVVGTRFACIAPCGGSAGATNYPADGATRIRLPYAPGLPEFVDETRYVDARISYRFASGIELFIDGRNLGRNMQQMDTGPYAPYANGTPMVLGLGYGGARYSAGLNFRY